MGMLIETCKKKYKNNDWVVDEYGFFIPKNFDKTYKFRKVRESFVCCDCKGKFGKGVVAIGKDYYDKRCFRCGIKMFEAMNKGIDDLKQKIEHNIKEYELFKTKWEKEAVLDKLNNISEK
jgi:hypothetical protein